MQVRLITRMSQSRREEEGLNSPYTWVSMGGQATQERPLSPCLGPLDLMPVNRREKRTIHTEGLAIL